MSFDDFFVQDAPVQKIIDKHCNDFTYNTYPEYIRNHGGYTGYVSSLGSVFSKYAGFKGKVKTKAELTEVMNYVWGLYNIWGTDYSNGCSYTFEENRYKAKAGAKSAFYTSKAPTSRFNMNYSAWGFANGTDLPGVDEMLSASKYYAVCNCGQGVVQTLKKAGLVPAYFPDPATYPTYYREHGYGFKIIRKASDLQVGDVLMFFNKAIPDRDTRIDLPNWMSGMFHTAIVGERDDKYIWMFDSGHAFTYYGECRNRRRIGDNNVYQWAADWLAIRLDCVADLAEGDGWTCRDGKWYYYRDGKKVNGWQKLKWSKGTNWFYFKDCVMVTGWQKLKWSGGENWFYFNTSGVMLTGMHRLSWNNKQSWYMFDSNGAMVTGEHEATVKFGTSGAMTGGKL